MATARVNRGRQSEEIYAEYLREDGWRHAERRAASLPGSDITGVPWDVEVKATRGESMTTWLKQQDQRVGRNERVAYVVYRPQGFGPATVADWPAIMRLDRLHELLHLADEYL